LVLKHAVFTEVNLAMGAGILANTFDLVSSFACKANAVQVLAARDRSYSVSKKPCVNGDAEMSARSVGGKHGYQGMLRLLELTDGIPASSKYHFPFPKHQPIFQNIYVRSLIAITIWAINRNPR
jgi:hypothetical protein